MSVFGKFLVLIFQAFVGLCAAGGPGYFDSHGGTYDEQTGYAFDRTGFYQQRLRTIIGPLTEGRQRKEVGQGPSIEGAVIRKKSITKGDMVRFTLEEYLTGLPTFGDTSPEMGEYLKWDNLEARVNMNRSPRYPVQAEMSRQKAGYSLSDIPGHVKAAGRKWVGEQMEIDFLQSLIYGASANILTNGSGGLGVQLGINGSAGVPLMPRHFYTPDDGYLDYDTTQTSWNSDVNDAINNITAGAGGEISLAELDIIRSQLDTIRHSPVVYAGKEYKSVVLLDPDLFMRLDNVLGPHYRAADERGATKNRFFRSTADLEWKEMRFISVPYLKRMRPAYDGSNSCPSIGIGDASNILKSDPRTYTTSSSYCWAFFLGSMAVVEGNNGGVNWTPYRSPHHVSEDWCGAWKQGFMRAEWFPKDGSTSADRCLSYGCLAASFYDRGVGTGYSYS